jgi:hypothetical protein
MGQNLLIVGDSGSGKSTACGTLNPKETFIINVAGKGLPFRGWKKNYTMYDQLANPSGNMVNVSSPLAIEQWMDAVNLYRPEIKTIVVDDWQYMSSFEFFDRSAEKGFEKFVQIGASLAKISKMPKNFREDLLVVFLIHAEDSQDLEGNRKVKAKTIGKMVDEKLTLEGLFTIVLFAKLKKNKEGELRHVFETKNNGANTCKAPQGMFPFDEIPNDLQYVRDCIAAYEMDAPVPAIPIVVATELVVSA